jgi:hypothetical protein
MSVDVQRVGLDPTVVSRYVLKLVTIMGTVRFQTHVLARKGGQVLIVQSPYALKNVIMVVFVLPRILVNVSNGRIHFEMVESQEADHYFKIKMETHCQVDGRVMTAQSQFVCKLKNS